MKYTLTVFTKFNTNYTNYAILMPFEVESHSQNALCNEHNVRLKQRWWRWSMLDWETSSGAEYMRQRICNRPPNKRYVRVLELATFCSNSLDILQNKAATQPWEIDNRYERRTGKRRQPQNKTPAINETSQAESGLLNGAQ